MPSVWDDCLNEFNRAAIAQVPSGPVQRAFWADLFEAKIRAVSAVTGTPLIVYASACTAGAGKVAAELLPIDASDKIGFHTIIEDLTGPNLDVLIHSGGGFADATESIVEGIRRKFQRVRFIVPSYAKSAATIMTMSGDEIIMDEDAELGPIDPQFTTRNGVVSGEAIKQQFKMAGEDILKDPRKAQVWFPIMQMLGPGLLAQCDNAAALSKNLVTEWLAKYMFRAVPDGSTKAAAVASFLSDHENQKTHGRRVKLEQLKAMDVAVTNLRQDPTLYRAVWELYCLIDILLTNTQIYKIFFNSSNGAIIRQQAPATPFALPFPFGTRMPSPFSGPNPALPQPTPPAPTPPNPASP